MFTGYENNSGFNDFFLPRYRSLIVMKTMAVLMKSFHKDKQVLVSVYEFACFVKAKKLGEALPHSN